MTDEFIVIAHRGASARYPENTLLAFKKALEAGATWLELDVHLTADGELVVIHDEYLDRTTSGRGPVAMQTLAQLRRLNAGLGEKIPLLAEVLDLAAGKATVNIELKGVGTAEPVARLLEQRQATGRTPVDEVLVSSLLPEEISAFASRQPTLRVAPIADAPDAQFWELAARLKAWSVHVDKDSVSAALVARARKQGVKLLVYTVNEQTVLEKLKNLRVAGVFSDIPEFFRGE